MTVTEIIESASLVLLGLAGLLAVARVVKDGSLPDKVLGADLAVIVLGSAVATGAALTADATYLDVLVVVTLLGFVGTITVARFVEQRGPRA